MDNISLQAKLTLKWNSLIKPFDIEQKISEKIFLNLVKNYSSSSRYYHNLQHINHLLEIIEVLREKSQNFVAIQFAVWFHDVIYNTYCQNNEEKSAEYMEIELNSLKIPQEIIHKAKNMILKTKNHQADENDIDSQILLDADMAILGSEIAEYANYAQGIRQEYYWVSEHEYSMGRKNFLAQILTRKYIYFNKIFAKTLELKARENIQWEIENLSRTNSQNPN